MSDNLDWLKEKPRPTRQAFHVDNWFTFCVEARDAGYGQDDIRWILNTVGVMDEMRRIVEADAPMRRKEVG